MSEEIKRLLLELYTPDEAVEWLCSEHKMLNGERPLRFIMNGREAEVLQLLHQLEDGVYI